MTYEEVLLKYEAAQGWGNIASRQLLLQFMQETPEPAVEKFETYLQRCAAEENSSDLVTAVLEMMKAKLRLWDASTVVEALLGFEVDTNGSDLNAHCGRVEHVEDVTEEHALALIADLRKEQSP